MLTKIIKRVIGRISGKGVGEETVRYLITGALTTIVNFCLFALMTKLLGMGITVSNVIAISAAILFAYVVNKLFVFNKRCESKIALAVEFTKFVGSRLFTMALEIGTVALFVYIFRQDELIGKAVSQVLVVIANYFISKLFVFKNNI